MGFRTLSLVGLASCIAVQAIMHSGLPQMNADAAGRVIQGILSGVGFIGAGALLHGGGDKQVHGLATAASIWVSAALEAASALPVWPLIVGGVVLALIVLFVGARSSGVFAITHAARRPSRTGSIWSIDHDATAEK